MSDWPHSPPHKISENGTYMITAGTLYKRHYLNSPEKLNLFLNLLFNEAEINDIRLCAWAVLSNHYHLILDIDDNKSMEKFISCMHRKSSIQFNKLDNISGRKVWFNYWDTHLTFQNSYYARINYVNNNPVHHGLVNKAEEYYWCSDCWFRYNLDKAFYKTVSKYKYDKIKVLDNF